jgi:DNA-directed RNA polymerase subunit E'/Rpb7
MFYHVTISQNIDLEPMYFGPKLKETIRMKIVDKVRQSLQQTQQQLLLSCTQHFAAVPAAPEMIATACAYI